MRKGWAKTFGFVAALGMALVAFGQDWPTYAGDNARSGHAATPTALSGPGRTFLRWWRPNTNDNPGTQVVVDNTSGSVSSNLPWTAPASIADEANNPFLPDLNATPGYMYANTVRSSTNVSTPDVPFPADAANFRSWTWTLDPADAVINNYAVYVWLPIGPTMIGGLPSYTQRYWVYAVEYGTGQRDIQIVDSWQGGTGWVRLGNGGASTNRVYAYDGINPIRVTLYNTVPRESDGSLTDAWGTTLVYADAAMVLPTDGEYLASPIVAQFASNPLLTHAVGARNRFIPQSDAAGDRTFTQGEVRSFDLFGATRWTWTPDQTTGGLQMDNLSGGVTAAPNWTLETNNPDHIGPNYYRADLTLNLANATAVTFAPTLNDGNYDVYAYLAASDPPNDRYGREVRYEIYEGPTMTPVVVNQNLGGGWVRIGTRQFKHDMGTGEPLSVAVTNFSSFPGDGNRRAFADAIRFVPVQLNNTAIHSTPVHVNGALINMVPGGPPVATDVVIAAAENGKLYCLDATGDGVGSTTVYWTYPSTPDPNNPSWTDPNQVPTEDGPGPTAEMPTGFDLSSALVQRINGVDYLFIGTRNGRVYCIEMAGRGDMNIPGGVPGTTRRVWSYPNDFPARPLPSNLGPITGSISYAVNSSGPTIYVPATQGRMYALDAVGNGANKTTNVRWRFPAASDPTLGPIVGTPAIAFGNIYFGTQVKGGDDRGRFYALDIDDGSQQWTFDSLLAWGPTFEQQTADDFNSGPVTIPGTEMAAMPNIVVVANDNRWITALEAATGVPLWTTDELAATVVGNLGFTTQSAFDNFGVYQPAPVVLVPTADGRLASLFAETTRTNIFGGNSRLAWGFETDSDGIVAQMAAGRNWLFAADLRGIIFAFSDTPGFISPGPPPGREVIVPNNPAGIPFREAKIRFVTKDTYDRLRLATGAANHLTYAQALAAARTVAKTGFEWGETVYALVYDLPYDLNANPVPPGLPPQVNYRFSVEGSSVRNVTVSCKQFSAPGSAPISPISGERLDGYAVTSFTIQGSGSLALPPGSAIASFTVDAQFSPGARMQNVALNPATTRRPFNIANPIAVATRFDAAGQPLTNHHIGYTVNPDDPEAAINGSPNISTTAKNENLLLSTMGKVPHGQQGTALMAIVDRSLMTLLRGPGHGLDGVRALRSDLNWQGGVGAVWKPINTAAYGVLMEQLPNEFPNNSLDYPDLTREFVTIIKDKYGNVENPVFGNVSLLPPTHTNGGPVDPNDPLNRIMALTPVDIEVEVPRFQSANLTMRPNSDPADLDGDDAGYYGSLIFYVDSSGNGQLDRRGRREAFRSLWVGGSIPVDERIVIETPVVDLGSLAEGAGYSPVAPYNAGPFSPWGGPYQNMFRSFEMRNEGNVNLRNLRVAKATDTGGAPTSWGLFAPANHERSWLDTRYSLWSDIDATYALNMLNGQNDVLLQKARPGDRLGTSFSTNPIIRANPFLDTNQATVLDPNLYPPAPARVAATIPIGTPVGTYITTIRVIEDELGVSNESMALDASGNSLEPYSDPTFVLRFNVREGRATNSFTTNTAPMVDGGLAGNEPFLHKNVQPTAFRDMQGQLVTAFASNRAGYGDPQPADASTNDRYRIYVATLNGDQPNPAVGQNPLKDLLLWAPPGTGRWFNQSPGAPLPDLAATPLSTIFNVQAGESVLTETVRFHAPSFPILGELHPLLLSEMDNAYLAYLGQCEKQTATGRQSETRILLQRISADANGTITAANPFIMGWDAQTSKGRPAVIQSNERATVFYAGTGTGTPALYYSHFDGTDFAQPQPIPLGTGFEEFGTPSVSGRVYRGASLPGLATGTSLIEMTFSGKLRGRAHSEIYFARLQSDSRLVPVNIAGQGSSVHYLPRRTQDRLVAEGEAGTYSAPGILWNTVDVTNPVVLEQRLNNVVTNLEVPGTRKIDQVSRKITFETTIGGTAYLDPELGTVRFAGTVPSRNATVLLSYTPRVIRLSMSGGSSYAGPSGLFDPRRIGEFSYWANSLNQAINPADQVRNDRYVFTYSRAAAGTGAAARPYMRTMRYGVQLAYGIHTQPNGNVTSMSVTAMAPTGFYQVDPANGKVFFTAESENMSVKVTYSAVDPTTGANLGVFTETHVVGMLGERAEGPVPIEQAVNESQLYSFIDPFDSAAAAERRPGLVWMFFTSTRAGGPDVYFQAIAPRLTPVATNRG